MAGLRRVIGGVLALFRKRRDEQDLDDELRAYLEASTEAKMRGGVTRADAIRAARVEMGSVEAVKDHTRDAGWEAGLESVWQDVRYALRTLRRSPGFAAVAILTLALGIGATTAIFSVVNAVLLRPLPFSDPDRLVTARGSLADLRDWQAAGGSFEDVAFWASNQFNLRLEGDSQQVLGGQVTSNLLPLLGVSPFLGRNFTEEDDRQDTVILGYAIWQARFGGDPGVLGRRVDMSGVTYTVIGVTPPWFRFPTAEFQLWAPLSSLDRKAPQQAKNRAFRIFSAVARLKPGATMQEAQAEAQAVSARLAQEPRACVARRERAGGLAQGKRSERGGQPARPAPSAGDRRHRNRSRRDRARGRGPAGAQLRRPHVAGCGVRAGASPVVQRAAAVAPGHEHARPGDR